MFEYMIDHPVTIARNRSALVPIVAAEIEGRAVDLYNEKTRADNPLAAVRLKKHHRSDIGRRARDRFPGRRLCG